MTEQELWKKVEAFFQKNFDMEPNPPIETILFLIGIQELGSGQQKYSKDDKLNLIHIAVCRLLEPMVITNSMAMTMVGLNTNNFRKFRN